MRTYKGVYADREAVAILKDMKFKALSERLQNKESAELTAIMYCGALLFARDRKLIDHNFARIMFNQFQFDYESADSLETPAREDHKR